MTAVSDEFLEESLGLTTGSHQTGQERDQRARDHLNLKFATRGFPIVGKEEDFPFLEMGRALILNFQERLRLLNHHRSPVDQVLTDWLRNYLADTGVFGENDPLLPDALILERHGLSRLLSIPAHSDHFESDIVSSYRTWQGVCHNPAKDRRTTKGVFHVTEGGLPIPDDKLAVPKITFARLLQAALHPPDGLNTLPYTSEEESPVRTFASILLRPLVSPEVPGYSEEMSMEIRFFAPGNLVSNLDFVESIFGNAGDPFLPENDARLDVKHWSGHTGCVILAPHLIHLTKKELGLPYVSEATERQKRDGMCWEDEGERYNNGSAFKVTARDASGVVVTMIADNYFGYCKKEVKTQISFATNLLGLAEEEHAGGALVFPSFDLGEDFHLSQFHREVNHTFAGVKERYGSFIDFQPEGYGIDKNHRDIIYLPEDAYIDLHEQSITWQLDGREQFLSLQPKRTYVLPSGYKVEMRKPSAGQRWRLVGTNAEGTFCHKPCTVSGGGKSEISKSLADAMQEGPVIMPRFEEDMQLVDALLKRDYSDRYKQPKKNGTSSRPILDPERSLGSVVRLFSTSDQFTDEYNAFVRSIPRTVRDFVLTLKRYWKPDWGQDWRNRFRVDSINGEPGFQLKYRLAAVMTSYLRVGYAPDGSWRMFGLRKDFFPATKLQREDDISASITVPATQLDRSLMHPDVDFPSYKFPQNCEYRLFQRPDDAIHRGYDKQTEYDFSLGGNFFSNYEPIDKEGGQRLREDSIRFDHFSEPLKKTLKAFAKDASGPSYVISSAHPRLVDGKASENPRYLQTRPDILHPRNEYLAEVGARLIRRIPADKPILRPVHAVLPGRRNNPSDHQAGIRPLAVYGPVHYQELPELFMDFIASLTGKSPSTTGAGSEGALTKGPFNALLPVHDLNAALLSFLLTGYHGFSTAAGYVGPHYKVDHDISLVVPEVWSRMFVHEREPGYLLERGMLEPVHDLQVDGETVHASRLGYRITHQFVETFFGRMFNDPRSVFSEDMLRPELQSMDDFIDGVRNITETQQKVALSYFADGSIELAIPPLRALLHVMAHGSWEGETLHSAALRATFTRESVLASDWYADRLEAKLDLDRNLLRKHEAYLSRFLERKNYAGEAERLRIPDRLQHAKETLARIEADPAAHRDRLIGSTGVEPRWTP